MKSILVIYNSKTGFTEKYAKWLEEEIPCRLLPYQKRKTVDFGKYDILVFGGGFYAGQIRGIKWLKSNLRSLQGKNVIVFATGASPAGTPDNEKALEQNFTSEERRQVKTFYLQGGLCYEKMGPVHKVMMALFRGMMKKQEGENSEIYQALCKSYDCSSKKNIEPLVKYITSCR